MKVIDIDSGIKYDIHLSKSGGEETMNLTETEELAIRAGESETKRRDDVELMIDRGIRYAALFDQRIARFDLKLKVTFDKKGPGLARRTDQTVLVH